MSSILESAIDYINQCYELSSTQINQLAHNFSAEIDLGISGEKSSLDSVITFMGPPSGKEVGDFIGIDLGGTNLRALIVNLNTNNHKPKITHMLKRRLTKKERSSTAKILFGAVADTVKQLIEEHPIQGEINIGFTFSFPVRQTSLTDATLSRWTKGFDIKEGLGLNPVCQLEHALKSKNIPNIRICAILNDTTGTLLSGAYLKPESDMGMILGTGTNICLKVAVSKVKKTIANHEGAYVYINLESGNFNKNLPSTVHDKQLDSGSNNVNEQLEEKMAGGKYLGLITSFLIKDLHSKHWLFNRHPASQLDQLDQMHSTHLSRVKETADLSGANTVLNEFGIAHTTMEDLTIFKAACFKVVERSASISAALICGAVHFLDPEFSKDHHIAIDGSLFEKYPGYRQTMEKVITTYFKAHASNIHLFHAEDGSGIGAGIAAAVAAGLKAKA
ncbi:MAG: hypothetical protein ABIJ31_16780 [Pseudomonadota bacterium]